MASIDEVLNCFKELNHVILATVDGDKPKLRPMTLVKHDSVFYFATGSEATKVKQLDQNPEVEIILQWKDESNNGYIRIEGTAKRENARETITQLYNRFDYFGKLWKSPDDPTLAIYSVNPRVYDYMKPGEWASVQIKTGN